MLSAYVKQAHRLAFQKRIMTLVLGLTLGISGCNADSDQSQATPSEDTKTLSEKKKELDITIKNPRPSTEPKKAPKKKPELTLGKDGVSISAASVTVYIGNGAIQCEFDGHPPSKTAAELEKIGTPVINSACGQRTGMMMTAMCGAGTTQINLHTIPNDWLQKAIEAGYKPVSDLARGGDKGYEVTECKSSANDR